MQLEDSVVAKFRREHGFPDPGVAPEDVPAIIERKVEERFRAEQKRKADLEQK